jgi:precorrin-3B C17-methyltransferase
MAAEGKRVVVVSSGDPGVFAMASAVFEALEKGPKEWLEIQIEVLPGITAMLAASARAGAPLGHDFCAINLSDNLKPWTLIEKRLRLAAEADFAMAFYNPRSKSRPEGFERTLEILKDACGDDRPVIFARNVSRPDETIKIVPLSQTTPDMADMRTMVLVGSSQTRIIERDIGPIVYTPRSVLK